MTSSLTWGETRTAAGTAPQVDAQSARTPAAGRPDPAPQLSPPQYPPTRTASPTRVWLRRAAIPVLVLLAWLGATELHLVPSTILPRVGDVWAAGWELTATGELGTSLAASLARVLVGVALGAGCGLVLGVITGLSRAGEQLIDAPLQVVRAIPFLAIVPLFIAWFGIDELFKLLVIAFATVTPMYAYAALAVRGIDPRVIEAARSYGLRGGALVREVILPLSLPGILMALRVSLSISIGALIAAENVGTRAGLGYLVSLAQQYSRVDYLFLCVVIYALLGLVFDAAIRLLERLLLPWEPRTVRQ